MRKLLLLQLLLVVQLYGSAAPVSKTMSARRSFCFRENKGQIRDQNGYERNDIDFVLAAKGLNIFIGSGQLHYQFTRKEAVSDPAVLEAMKKMRLDLPGKLSTYRMDVSLTGANLQAPLVVSDRTEAVDNFYLSSVNGKGITDVHSFKKIIYKDIYPGIDWVLYTKDNALKYDFIVHAGANPADIRLQYKGASSLSLKEDGSLEAITSYGSILEQRPYAYQQQDGKQVATRFVLQDKQLAFASDTYQGSLVIDPGVDWSTYFGGGDDENTGGVTCDTAGYIYLTGGSYSMSNIATSGSYQTVFGGGLMDAYLAKFDSLGTLLWATYYGGENSSAVLAVDFPYSVACDRSGHVYIAGLTNSVNGIATPGSYQTAYAGAGAPFIGGDAFLAQFSSNGQLQWGTYYGGAGDEGVSASLAFDQNNNVFMSTATNSLSGMTTAGCFQSAFAGGDDDGLLAKFNSAGALQWATYYGGADHDDLIAVAVDNTGAVYAGGATNSASGVATSGSYQPAFASNNSSYDGLLVKFNNAGSRIWATYYGGENEEVVSGLALDASDNIYVTGHTSSTTGMVTTGCYQPFINGNNTFVGPGDVYLAKFNAAGARQWSTYYGGEGFELWPKLAYDKSGAVYITGSTNSASNLFPDIIATPGSHQDTLAGDDEGFLAQFTLDGARRWATYFGGTGSESNLCVAAGRPGNIYLAGLTGSTSGITTPGSYQPALTGGSESFLARFVPVDLQLTGVAAPQGDTVCKGMVPLSVLLNNNGRRNQTDSIYLSCNYTTTGFNGSLDTAYAGTLAAGATATVPMGMLDMSTSGTYQVQVYLQYTRDDSSRLNDTLNFTLVVIDQPSVDGITQSNSGNTYSFTADNPQHVTAYHWTFGDGQSDNAAAPSHDYAANGNYTVTLIVSNGCSSDTAVTTVNITQVGIEGMQPLNGDVVIYPNPVHQFLYVKAGTGINITAYSILNSLGQTVNEGSTITLGRIDAELLSAGSYLLKLDTDKGSVCRRFQVIR